MKRKDIEIDWAKFNSYVGNFMMNAFIHVGYQDDYMLNSHIQRENIEINPSESQIQVAQAEVQQNSG